MEILLGVLIVSALVMGVPKAIADAYVTAKAAAAGAWDFLEKDRARRDAKWNARGRAAAAWAERRRARHQQAGDSGDYRPGAKAYGQDLYHGFWERRLQVRAAKRAGRPAYVHDPDRLKWHERVDAALVAKVKRLRQRRDAERAERSAPEQPPPPLLLVLPDDLPPGTWTVGQDGERVPLAAPVPTPPVTPAAPTPPATQPDPVVSAWVGHPDWGAATPPGTTLTPEPVAAPAPASSAPTQPAGGTTMTAPTATVEVQTNEDARTSFKAQMAAAEKAADALAVYEAAQKDLRAAATAAVDGMSATKFDAKATAAAANVADLIGPGDLSQAAGAIDGIRAAAEEGYLALEKYRDPEELVAVEQIDPATLAATSS